MQSPDFLPIDFIIIGGSICGLSSAIALRRAGHNVTVFDIYPMFAPNPVESGCRLSPNSTKLYYRWGLEKQLREASVKATGNLFVAYDTGGVYGGHEWEEEVISETGGDFLCIHYHELRRILAEAAIELGTKIRAPMNVVSVHPHPERPWVTLENGELVYADVLVGCDGSAWKGWVTRTEILKAFGQVDVCESAGIQLYAMTVPDAALDNIKDAGLRAQLRHSLFTLLGAEYSAIGFPSKAEKTLEPELLLFVYGPPPDDRMEPAWAADKAETQRVIDNAGPLLRELVASAPGIICIPIVRRNSCPEWVHPDGRLIIMGEGAHPLILGTIFGVGMSTGDAAALGRVFSHLSRKDQIDSFLSAVQEVRKERIEDVMRRAAGNIFAVSIPPSVAAMHNRERDRQVDKGLKTLKGKRRIEPESSEQLIAAVENIFAIDPEDEADDWWVRWGALESRVARWTLSDGELGSDDDDDAEEEEEEEEEEEGPETPFGVKVVTEVHPH
ncbi:hypothetical protein V8D89_016203 [Ganoderma adspersum]